MINISKLFCSLSGQSDNLRYASSDSVGPIIVYNCTPKCNLNCLHCYSKSRCDSVDTQLTTDQAMNLLAQLTEINCPVILFSGGEPLLRSDIFQLLIHAKNLGLRTVLSTNGTLIDKDTATRLADAGLGYAGISLDGTEQIHDKFRMVKGSFKATIKGIENCQNAGLKTGLRFTITKQNADQVEVVFDIAVNACIRRLCFYHLISTGRAAEMNQQTLASERTRQLVDIIIEKTEQLVTKDLVDEVLTVGNHADGPYVLLKLAKQKPPLFEPAKKLLLANGGNRIGEKIGCVSWDGTVYADQFWRNYPLGNINKKSLKNIWYNANDPVLQKLRNKTKFAAAECLDCRWFDYCKGNYRFLQNDPSEKYWQNEPACYLTKEQRAK
jgi:Fe-coproporphyrin III synthase